MTNHALDSFLDDLRKSGIPGLIRLGGNSKEPWTKGIQLSAISRNMKKTSIERRDLSISRDQTEALTNEGTSWCESLSSQALSWPAVREHLKRSYPDTLKSFTALEQVEEAKLSDIRLARKAGGFAFEFWSCGGDIQDINRLLAHFESLLGDTHEFQEDADDHDVHTRSRVLDQIFWNADAAAKTNASSENDIWRLTLSERKDLLERWTVEIEPQTISDRTAEIHRRHQAATLRRQQLLNYIDARILAQRECLPREGKTRAKF